MWYISAKFNPVAVKMTPEIERVVEHLMINIIVISTKKALSQV